jgi:hypothetical protein
MRSSATDGGRVNLAEIARRNVRYSGAAQPRGLAMIQAA